MRFVIQVIAQESVTIPINYNYPLSSTIYRIIAKDAAEYAPFLHQSGYGKGFRLFTFSQISCPFQLEGDRIHLLKDELSFQVAFHLSKAMESFIKGLFLSERITIADKKSRAVFWVKSVTGKADPLQRYQENEIVSVLLKPLSPIVAGLQNKKRNYDFLSPDDVRFSESLIFNWQNKIKPLDCKVSVSTPFLLEKVRIKNPAQSRLLTIKSGTPEETKIRGWMNFGLKVTVEKHFVEVL